MSVALTQSSKSRMSPAWPRREVADPRIWQIAALTALLAWNITQLSTGADLVPSLVAVASAVAMQRVCAYLCDAPARDMRSPLVTGLSLALLLRGDALWVPAAAALIAIATKFLIRFRRGHVMNPAAIAIVALVATGHAWVSPGQWGQSALLVVAMTFLAILVLTRASCLDTALAFLAAHAGLLAARAIWLGDPIAVPLHQLQNGGLLLFAFFMITDPRTTPDVRGARIVFAVVVAGAAYWLAFAEQIRAALYVALVVASPLVPLLDKVCPPKRSVLVKTMEAKA